MPSSNDNNQTDAIRAGSLQKHRMKLKANTIDRYTKDRDRAITQFAMTAYNNYEKCGSNKKHVIQKLKQMGELVFNAQKSVPLYEFDFGNREQLPRAWNSPMKGGWDVNYIKWEIGHLMSKNKGGLNLNKPENLSFQSARCNQHVQSGLDFNETTEYKYVPEIRNRVAAIFDVHKTPEWSRLTQEIAKLTISCKK